MHDPVADMLTRIRNSQRAKHQSVTLMSSNLKVQIAKVLKEEGYIADFSVEDGEHNHKFLTVLLKYFHGRPVIEKIKRISRPGLRIYQSSEEIKSVPGFGISILTTPKGVMSHVKAKALRVGGEIICEVA